MSIVAYAVSENDAISWMNSKNGTTITDGGTQCVAAFNAYLRLFGISNPIGQYPVGGAKQIFDYNAPSGWQKISGSGNYRVGDVVVWNGNVGGGSGHVGMVYSTSGTVKIFDQNWTAKNKCGIHTISSESSIRGVFRPPFSNIRPTNVRGDKNQYWYDIKDTIKIYGYADNATDFEVCIDDSTGKRRVEYAKMNGNVYSISASSLGIGEYVYCIIAKNSAGGTQSAEWYPLPIVGKPGFSGVSVSKSKYSLNETVSISVSTICAKGQVIGLDKNYNRIVTKDCAPTYTESAQNLGVGSYSAYFSVYNGSGSIDTYRVTFLIYGSKPNSSSVSTNKSVYAINEDVTFKFDSDTATEYTIGIDDPNGKRIDTKTNYTNSYTRKFDKCGVYSCYVTSANCYGGKDSTRISFTIGHQCKSTAAQAATCTTNGNIAYWYCPLCNKYFSDSACTKEISQASTVIKATGHKWNAPTYSWSADNKTCTATRVCANDSSHKETETVSTTYSITKQPTCTDKGTGTYTVTFKNSAFAKQTKNIDIPAKGHNWGAVTYSWSSDSKTCTATRVCANDSFKETETVNTSYSVTKQPNCTDQGTGTFAAIFKNTAFTKQTKNVDIPATGHSYTDKIVAPTPTSQGYTLHECSRCGDSYKTDFTDYKANLTIHYNTNGGSINSTDFSVSDNDDVYKADGSAVNEIWADGYGHPYGLYNASTFGMYREGYEFLGWSLTLDDERIFGEDEKITSNDLYPDITKGDAAIKLYARWKAVPYSESNYPVVYCALSPNGRQFRLKWNAVPGAEKYGIAVYQSNRWKLKVQTTATSYTSPKLSKGTYKLAVCAKIGSKWDTSNIKSRAVTVTIN